MSGHSSPVLEVRELHKHFGGVRALDGMNLVVNGGEILGIVGPNGAGKTALLNTLTGFYRPTSGSITFLGQEISHTPMHQIGRLGIGRTFQNIRLFRRMSVLENVMAADHSFGANPFRAVFDFAHRAPAKHQALAWLDALKLTDKADLPAGSLSYGDARRLEIARALAGRPHLLLLDEPAAGMNSTETAQLVDDIRRINASLQAIILIEHDMSLIRKLSTRVVAMEYGRKIAEGPADEVLRHPEVLKAYLGEEDTADGASINDEQAT